MGTKEFITGKVLPVGLTIALSTAALTGCATKGAPADAEISDPESDNQIHEQDVMPSYEIDKPEEPAPPEVGGLENIEVDEELMHKYGNEVAYAFGHGHYRGIIQQDIEGGTGTPYNYGVDGIEDPEGYILRKGLFVVSALADDDWRGFYMEDGKVVEQHKANSAIELAELFLGGPGSLAGILYG